MCPVEGNRLSQDSSVVNCQDLMSKNMAEMTKLYLRWSDIVELSGALKIPRFVFRT